MQHIRHTAKRRIQQLPKNIPTGDKKQIGNTSIGLQLVNKFTTCLCELLTAFITTDSEVSLQWRYVCVHLDIDECAHNSTNQCNTTTTRCVNEPGSYSCSCLPGFYGPAGSLSCNGSYWIISCFYVQNILHILHVKGKRVDNSAIDGWKIIFMGAVAKSLNRE